MTDAELRALAEKVSASVMRELRRWDGDEPLRNYVDMMEGHIKRKVTAALHTYDAARASGEAG